VYRYWVLALGGLEDSGVNLGFFFVTRVWFVGVYWGRSSLVR